MREEMTTALTETWVQIDGMWYTPATSLTASNARTGVFLLWVVPALARFIAIDYGYHRRANL